MGAALAFYSILSITPLVVIATAIVGFVFGEEAAQGKIVAQLQGLIGAAGAEVVQTTLRNAHQPRAGIIASLLGIVTLLFGASGVFAELKDDLNTVWKVGEAQNPGWYPTIRNRLLSFAMVLVVGILLLISLIVGALLSVLGAAIRDLLPQLAMAVMSINFLISMGVTTTLFALLFRYLPDVQSPWRVVFGGAALTAMLFAVGKFAIGLYVGRAGIATPFGAAGSVVVFVVWIYYSALIFLYGAEITYLLDREARASRRAREG
jgi:membrane protein